MNPPPELKIRLKIRRLQIKCPNLQMWWIFNAINKAHLLRPLTFPVAQGGDGALTYTLSSLPPGLTYTPPSEEDAHGGVLSGTPTETQAKIMYTLTATDEDEDVARALFYIVVMVATSSDVEADRMPSFEDTVTTQSYVQNREIEAITLPQATGGDGALTYALSPDLPEGLTFNTETRVLSGLPTEALGETTYTLTATDGDGDEATLRFALAVAEDLMPSFADTVVAPPLSGEYRCRDNFPRSHGWRWGAGLYPLAIPAR